MKKGGLFMLVAALALLALPMLVGRAAPAQAAGPGLVPVLQVDATATTTPGSDLGGAGGTGSTSGADASATTTPGSDLGGAGTSGTGAAGGTSGTGTSGTDASATT